MSTRYWGSTQPNTLYIVVKAGLDLSSFLIVSQEIWLGFSVTC